MNMINDSKIFNTEFQNLDPKLISDEIKKNGFFSYDKAPIIPRDRAMLPVIVLVIT